MKQTTPHNATVAFLGGTGSVTGAHFLLDAGEARIGIDCGLKQGGEFCDETNYEPFPEDPSTFDALIITHAHLDHIGRIPQFVKHGFKGPIYSTAATKELAALMFDDSVAILADEARRCNRDIIFGREDIEQALNQWRTHEYHETFAVTPTVSCTFKDAGHILGSTLVVLERGGKKIVFTGDLGNSPDVLLPDTESIKGAHFLVMESVYGDRLHEGRDERRQVLRAAIDEARKTKSVLLIPSFSIQRTQVLLSEINSLVEDGMEPMPLFLDSPLSIKVLSVYKRYQHLFNKEAQQRISTGDDLFDFPKLTLTKDAEDSAAIERAENPKIIIAGSGMSHGGRIRSHEKRYLGDKKAILLFVGYQTVGSLGRRIKDGASRVKIDGDWVRVRARIAELRGYSAHKDRDGLIAFVEDAQETLEQVFVAMGEPRASLFLTQRLRDFLGIDAQAPEQGSVHTIAW